MLYCRVGTLHVLQNAIQSGLLLMTGMVVVHVFQSTICSSSHCDVDGPKYVVFTQLTWGVRAAISRRSGSHFWINVS